MLIGLSGRIKSGKGHVSDYLVSKGFEKITIAGPLKKMIATIYDLDISYCYNQELKKKELNLLWNKNFAAKVSQFFNIPLHGIWLDDDVDIVFRDVRQALQHIGSEVLRRYDKDFHVKITLKDIDSNKNYVCDDVRFLNEKKEIEKRGGKCVIILRPNQWSVSNHISETSLNWKHFVHVLVNNKDLNYLELKINKFINQEFIVKNKIKTFDCYKLFDMLQKNSTKDISKELNCSRDKIVWWADRYLLHIDTTKYNYDNEAFLNINEESAYFAGLISADGCVKKSGKSNRYVLELTSDDVCLINSFKMFIKTNKKPYKRIRNNGKIAYVMSIGSLKILENVKLWNIEPKKSKFNKVPEILLRDENKKLIDYWFVGLIDGDGCVNKDKGHIRCIASKEIIYWLADVYADYNPKIYSEKGIKNLFNINFHGKYAKKLAQRLPIHRGLERKWSFFNSISLKKH